VEPAIALRRECGAGGKLDASVWLLAPLHLDIVELNTIIKFQVDSYEFRHQCPHLSMYQDSRAQEKACG